MRLRKKAHFCFMCYSKGSNFLHVISPPITDSMLFLYLVHLLILVLFARLYLSVLLFPFHCCITLLYHLSISHALIYLYLCSPFVSFYSRNVRPSCQSNQITNWLKTYLTRFYCDVIASHTPFHQKATSSSPWSSLPLSYCFPMSSPICFPYMFNSYVLVTPLVF